jgi:hypothetical protein
MIKFEAEKTCNLKLVSTKKFALKSRSIIVFSKIKKVPKEKL